MAVRPSTRWSRKKSLVLILILVGVVSVIVLSRIAGDKDPYSRERMSAMIELRCAETQEVWSMTRGRMEAELRGRPGQLDATRGIASPFAEGRPSGFPTKSRIWDETIQRINDEKRALSGSGGP